MSTKKQYTEWLYTLAETQSHIDLPKIIKGNSPKWRSLYDKSNKQELKTDVVFKDRPSYPVSMGYYACGTGNITTSYRCSFILDGERTRGIDYAHVKNRYMLGDDNIREIGWHENIVYYDTQSKIKRNDHHSLGYWSPQDLDTFYRFSCKRWHIELIEEGEKRLF